MMSMKSVLLLCVVAAAVIAEQYTDKYDNIDIDEIIGNKRLLIAYVDCVLEKGKCTPEGKTLKDHLADGLATGCEKCTEKQKEGTEKVITHLIKNEKEIWDELCKKYDPTGEYRKKYEKIAKEKGIEIPA